MRNAVSDADPLRVFREKPDLPACIGIGLILISYAIGWPAVALLGLVAFYSGKPLILAVGGPVAYGLSHLVFMVGLYLGGKRYALALAHWASRKAFLKYSGTAN
jgi:hypothetical protein